MELAKHVQKMLNAQRDILSPQAVEALEGAVREMHQAIDSDASKEALQKQATSLEAAANKWLKPYPNPAWRENVEVLLVAIAVAMAIRTFFLQPFKIPTGSMQPTLYGVTFNNLLNKPNEQVPGVLGRIFQACYYGTFYHEVIAPADGEILKVAPVRGVGINRQIVWVQYAGQSSPTAIPIWFAPDDPLDQHPETGVQVGKMFRSGEPVFKFSETTGDHLFVDRVTYNFRHPTRGEIVVFKTKGIEGLPPDQFYIKRLVGLPGEKVSIGDDRHVRINNVRLDAATPHFENVYSFNPTTPPAPNQYSGHVQVNRLFPDSKAEVEIPEHEIMVFGDNTMNSYDSRYWGPFPEKNVIGKSWFVYWPISGRFGWGQQ